MTTTLATTIGRGGTPSRRGFTLVELVVVMIIVAIVGATAISAMASTQQTKQRVAVRMLVRDLQAARERAVSLGTPNFVRVYLSTELVDYLSGATFASALALTETGSGLPLRTRLHTNSADSLLHSVRIGTVAGATTPDPYIFGFDWLGRPTDSAGTLLTADIPITITVPSYTTATVTVRASSGAVTYTLP